MRWTVVALLVSLSLAPAARGQDFDYWLLALSWSPSWCATEGDGAAEQCAPARDLGFVLHGLWPQDAVGWPENCDAATPDPSRRETAAMADVMGSGGLAWRQWLKHGRCAGLTAEDYFALSRRAFGRVALPRLEDSMTADAVSAAFVDANVGLASDALVVTCRNGLLREVRLCLTRDLAPRACGADVARGACRSRDAIALPDAP